jgi:4,5-dihydroxyphthalate decarboxylase
MRQKLELSIALHDNARTLPIIEGRVEAEGINLVPTVIHGSEIFWRQLKYGDFDISDMSMSSLLIATSQGDDRWVAIPAFAMRSFFHTGIMVRTDRGIEAPADLKGKRIGVPEYQQTSALWSRGILQHEFGVTPRDIEWFMERTPEISHGGATGFEPPEGVKINQIPGSTNIGEMLAKGELDGTLLYLRSPNLVDRSRIDLSTLGTVKRLFKDPDAEKRRYYVKTGIFPINHTLVVRRSLLERYPWIALNIYSAFVAAKAEAATTAQGVLTPYLETGVIGAQVKKQLSEDPMSYGMKAARPVLEAITQYSYEQGLTKRHVKLEEIFAPSTLEI